jgi:putative Mg2+ transporter-C (MgtC) family protein
MIAPVLLLADLGEAFGEVNDVYPSAEAVWRLVAAALLGAVVGIEREVNDQPAGLRTHITVALGAAVFGIVSTLGFSEFVTDQRAVNVQFDVTRVASNVVVGIGFLGAGMIFRAGSRVRNLTTAASLWVTAAFGLAAGVGDIGIATVAAVALVVALFVLRIPRNLLRRRFTRPTVSLSIEVASVAAGEQVLDALRQVEGVRVGQIGWGKSAGNVVLDVELHGEVDVRPEERLRPIVDRPEVIGLRTDIAALATADDEA